MPVDLLADVCFCCFNTVPATSEESNEKHKKCTGTKTNAQEKTRGSNGTSVFIESVLFSPGFGYYISTPPAAQQFDI